MDNYSAATASSTSVRFNLKTLLFAVAAIGLTLAPVRWFGAMYVISMLGSLVLMATCLWAYGKQRRGTMIAIPAFGFFPTGGLMSVAFLMHAALNLIAVAICALLKIRVKTAAYLMCAAMIPAYGVAIWMGWDGYNRLNAMLANYPLISVEPRLAFERLAPKQHVNAASGPTLSKQVLDNLTTLEENDDFSIRGMELRRLHDDTYRQFAIAAGFGSARMLGFSGRWVELSPRRQISTPLQLRDVSKKPILSELERVNFDIYADFVDPERIGFVRSVREVAGFEAHGFSKLPEELCKTTKSSENRDPSMWSLSRLELVSLLRHGEPTVYAAATLPRTDQLGEVPTRPLSDFEKGALPKLVSQEDLVIDEQPARIQMLGSVRAGKSCLQCHEGDRGQLLGAFSYELEPTVASTKDNLTRAGNGPARVEIASN